MFVLLPRKPLKKRFLLGLGLEAERRQRERARNRVEKKFFKDRSFIAHFLMKCLTSALKSSFYFSFPFSWHTNHSKFYGSYSRPSQAFFLIFYLVLYELALQSDAYLTVCTSISDLFSNTFSYHCLLSTL